MKFKTTSMELFFRGDLCQRDMHREAEDFDIWSARHGLPEPTVSDLQRPKQRNTDIYFARNVELRTAATTGDLSKLSLKDQEKAKWCRGKSDAELLRDAEAQVSWHCFGCAVDFSGNAYTPEQREEINAYFEARLHRPMWEYMLHRVVGENPHFHIGRRDFDHRRRVQLIRDVT